MLTRLLYIVVGASVTIGCSMFAGSEPGLIISLSDPEGRLGAPPWRIAVFNPYFGPEQARAMSLAGSAAPERPFGVATSSRMEEWRVQDLLVADQSTVFGLALPSLRDDGYWLARVDHNPGEFSGTGSALFCRWGEIEPDQNAEELSITVRHRREAPGLQLETTVLIPARPRASHRAGR